MDRRPWLSVFGVWLSPMYKFEKLEVYQLALDYVDLIYALADRLPQIEEFNLKAQMRRAATSVVLNIAEGSTGQTNAEQSRFLGMAVRSLFETVACRDLICRRKYIADDDEILPRLAEKAETLSRKLQAMRRVVTRGSG
jgi:four helix bundle protein